MRIGYNHTEKQVLYLNTQPVVWNRISLAYNANVDRGRVRDITFFVPGYSYPSVEPYNGIQYTTILPYNHILITLARRHGGGYHFIDCPLVQFAGGSILNARYRSALDLEIDLTKSYIKFTPAPGGGFPVGFNFPAAFPLFFDLYPQD